MKRKLLIALIAITAAICGAFGFSACGDKTDNSGNGGNTEQGGNQGEIFTDSDKLSYDKGATQGLAYELYPDGSCYVCCGKGEATGNGIVIPFFYNGKPVKYIGDYAFACENFASITITPDIISIGKGAFEEFYSSLDVHYLGGLASWCGIEGLDNLLLGNIYVNNQLLQDMTSLTIPEGVTSISDFAFWNCSKLISITLPDGLTSIGKSTFADCSALESITLPDSVTNIGNNAFYGCWSLKSVSLSNSVTSIGIGLFGNCRSLAGLTVPDSVTIIGGNAFYNCVSLTSITIPDSVTCVGDRAFIGCDLLTNVTIGNGVQSIGSSVFENCYKLTSITVDSGNNNYKSADGILYSKDGENLIQYAIGKAETLFVVPDGVTSIGSSAFENCSKLTSISFPDSLTNIGENAFNDCHSLEEIKYSGNIASWCEVGGLCYLMGEGKLNRKLFIDGAEVKDSLIIPDGIKHIGDYSFYGCRSVTNLSIPDSVVDIGPHALMFCVEVKEVTLPAFAIKHIKTSYKLEKVIITSGESIGDYAFSSCDSLESITISDSVTYIGENAFENCSSLESITLPDSVTSIGEYAFSGCSSLKSITLSKGLTSVGKMAFKECPIKIAAIPMFAIGDISKTNLQELTILNGDYIEINMFKNCSSLTSITLPDSLTSISHDAFIGCDNLQFNEHDNVFYLGNSENPYLALIKVKNADNITSCTIHENTKVIAEQAFDNCLLLESIVIPNGIKSIGWYTFRNCRLLSVSLPDSVTSIGYGAYWGCSSLTNIKIPDTLISIDSEAFYGCNNLQQYKEYNNAYYLGTSTNSYFAFISPKDNTIASCTINENTKIIADKAFANNSSLKSITIPNSVTHIGSNAFSRCISLTSVIISDSVTSIGNSAFYGCWSLTNVTIGNGVTNIGGGAFSDCSSLTSIIIPNSVTSIGDFAFSGCTAFTSITIPDSVTSIGECAFSGCSSLASVTIPDSVTTICSATFSGCSSLISVTIGNGVINIGNSAFGGCDSLTSIIIPNSVVSIDNFAFNGCSSLTSIIIPDSVKSIGEEAFRNCTSLTEIKFKNMASYCKISRLDNVDKSKIYIDGQKLMEIASIVIPDGVTSIGSYAFCDCGSLKSITISKSVTSIGSSVFTNCSTLTEITFKGTKEDWNAIEKGLCWDGSTGNYIIHCTDGDLKK